MVFLKKFQTEGEYNSYIIGSTAFHPNTSLIGGTDVKYEKVHEFVDLGLPSGKKWMKYNLGANSETESGYFFQWGQTEGHDLNRTGGTTDYTYSWSTAPFNNGSSSFDSDYFTAHKSEWLDGDVLKPQYDAAYQATNGVAHMPTKEDFEELINNTTSEWVTIDGAKGEKFTASNGNYIFFPAAGFADDSSMSGVGSGGYVWISTLYSSTPTYAWYVYFNRNSQFMDDYYRYLGFSVRGVCDR